MEKNIFIERLKPFVWAVIGLAFLSPPVFSAFPENDTPLLTKGGDLLTLDNLTVKPEERAIVSDRSN